MPQEEAEFINARTLSDILSMPCFKMAEGAKTFREREFLCALPANSFLDTDARDDVLVQGAIDLLCEKDGKYAIIDYKFSSLAIPAIAAKYSKQLNLYRLAVQKILGVKAEDIEAHIVNIRTLKAVKLDF